MDFGTLNLEIHDLNGNSEISKIKEVKNSVGKFRN